MHNRRVRIRSPVFVGRREELGQLTAWLDNASAGQPHSVVIGGEAGVGKSRLVDEFRRVAAARGALWLIGAAADYGEGGLPFGAIVEALRPVVQRSSAGVSELGVLLPELVVDDGVGAADGSGSADSERLSRLQVFERLLDLLSRLARDQPVVLVLEDLHWADVSTREFFAFLARNLGSTRLLAIATYRSEDVSREHPLRRYLLELGRGNAEMVELNRFDRDEVRQQLSAIRGADVADEVIDALFARSQGNAFFSEELLASAMGDALPSSLPPSLRELMLARFDQLSPATRSLAAVVAVAGTADEALLAAVSELDEDAVLVGLREAIERSILQPIVDERYGFRHDLLREAIYEDLLPGERARLHRDIAQALATTTGGEAGAQLGILAQLAHHWELAGRPDEAFRAALRAAEAADRAFAKPEASRLFERAAELWPSASQPEGDLRAELERTAQHGVPADRATLYNRAAASAASFSLGQAIRLAQTATEHFDAEVDPDRFVLIQERIGTWGREIGQPIAAARADDLLGQAINRASPFVRARMLVSRSDGALVRGDFDQALNQAREGLAAAEETGKTADRLWALLTMARASGYSGRLDDAQHWFVLVRSIATEAHDSFWLAQADKWEGDVLQSAAQFLPAVDLLRSAAKHLLAIGESGTAKHALVIAAQALHRVGRWSEAAAELEAALIEPAVHWARVVRALLLVGQGRMVDAQLELDRAAEFVALSGSTGTFGPYYAALAEKSLWLAEPAEALAFVDDGLTHVGDDLRWIGELHVLGIRAAADAGTKAMPRAASLMERLRDKASRGLATGTIFEPELRAALASAEAEMSRVSRIADPSLYERAAEAWLAIPEPYPAAYARYRQAEALLATKRKAAAEPLAHAIEIARELGAQPLLEAAEGLARRARLDVGVETSAAVADSYGLTARELEVLGLLARGRSDREIASELFISPKTASVHVSNVKGKLGVERRIEAAQVGLRLGLGGS
jgi:DNA-binding CsgD family transcriptional regulator